MNIHEGKGEEYETTCYPQLTALHVKHGPSCEISVQKPSLKRKC